MLKRTKKSARALRAADEKLLDDAVKAAIDELEENLPAEVDADDLGLEAEDELEADDLEPEGGDELETEDELESDEDEGDEDELDADEESDAEDELEADEDELFDVDAEDELEAEDEVEAGDECADGECEADEDECADGECEADEDIIPDDKPAEAVLSHKRLAKRYAARKAARMARYAKYLRKADVNRPGVEDTLGNQLGGGAQPSVSTLDDTGIPVSEAKSLAAAIDKIANYCQKHGENKVAYHLDIIANTLDPKK